MEGIVAKRCLRQSSIKKSTYDYRVNKRNMINEIYNKNDAISKVLNKEENAKRKFFEKIVFKLKMKMWIQSITAMCLLILIIVVSMVNVKAINDNKYIIALKKEYKKNYSLEYVKQKIKVIENYGYKGVKYVMSDRVENNFRRIYKDLKNIFKRENNNALIYENSNNLVENKIEDTAEKGVGVSIDENVKSVDISNLEEKSSAISLEDESLEYIKKSNIKFVMPTTGNISSSFGVREVIFNDIDSYHTGVDIANKKGTNIVSSTDGNVTKVANNKYNGNFVEITNGEIITKYAHMDSVEVKKGDKVKAGQKIGLMGETGYATGPHLHFEVVVKGVKINPAKVLNI